GGWCERAERLISDRLDGALTPAGRARLDAHMGGCERCATHERKLIQAHDLLVEGYLAEHAPARPRAVPAEATPAAAELRMVTASPDHTPPAERPRLEVAWYVGYGIAVLAVIALIVLVVTGLIHVP
ncbi:MAG TPA: zf-HC2 domain-containing protein, partial [Thermoleophilaceae bacterium]